MRDLSWTGLLGLIDTFSFDAEAVPRLCPFRRGAGAPVGWRGAAGWVGCAGWVKGGFAMGLENLKSREPPKSGGRSPTSPGALFSDSTAWTRAATRSPRGTGRLGVETRRGRLRVRSRSRSGLASWLGMGDGPSPNIKRNISSPTPYITVPSTAPSADNISALARLVIDPNRPRVDSPLTLCFLRDLRLDLEPVENTLIERRLLGLPSSLFNTFRPVVLSLDNVRIRGNGGEEGGEPALVVRTLGELALVVRIPVGGKVALAWTRSRTGDEDPSIIPNCSKSIKGSEGRLKSNTGETTRSRSRRKSSLSSKSLVKLSSTQLSS